MSFLIALALGSLLTPVAATLGRRLRAVDRPAESLKIHERPVSTLGGLSVIVATFGAMVATGTRLDPAVLGGLVIVLLAGLADDLRPLPALARVAAQIGAGVILLVGGIRLEPLGLLGAVGLVVVVLACANAVNLVDGQDGLAGGLAAVAALGLAVLALQGGDHVAGTLGMALAGALFAFLVWNRPPARIFLGNGGAYAVGTLLAILAARVANTDGWRSLMAAGACLGVFAMELTLTVARRMRSAQSLATGDRHHSYDVLSEVFGNRTFVTLMFCGLGAVAVGLALAIVRLPLEAAVAITATVWAAALIVTWRLSVATRLHRLPKSK